MTDKQYADLRPGDCYVRDNYDGTTVTVAVLTDSEPWRDPFGRTLARFWARRSDTDAEGWVSYGPGAYPVRVIV